MRSYFFCCLLLALLVVVHRGESQVTTTDACNGVFDFYVLLDSSGSIIGNFRTQVVPFVINLTRLYAEPELRFSIMTFSTGTTVFLNLTRSAERGAINSSIEQLMDHVPGGATNINPALEIVINQIREIGGDRASVVLIITDGVYLDSRLVVEPTLSVLRNTLGARVFTIGIGEVDPDQLNGLADNPTQVFIGSSFQYLQEVVQRIRSVLCIEINQIVPNFVCITNITQFRLDGSGFTNDLNRDRAICRFRTQNDIYYTTKPSGTITANEIICPAPNFNMTGSVLVQISLNGITFIGSHAALEIDDCKSIASGTPSQYCRGQADRIDIVGAGLAEGLVQSAARCRFTLTAGQTFLTEPHSITATRMICPTPNTGNYSGSMSLSVTIDGNFFINDVVTITINDCSTISNSVPTQYCQGQEDRITIDGNGFTDEHVDESRAQCRFTTATGEIYFTAPLQITATRVICPTPNTGNYFGSVSLHISANGDFFIDEVVTFVINNCTRISSTTPTKYCRGREVDVITITGFGFNVVLNQSISQCHFRTATNQTYITRTPVPTMDTRITCPTPDTGLYTGSLTLQITSDGYSFITDNVIIRIDDCTMISSTEPTEYCRGRQVDVITIIGFGFNVILNQSISQCHFRTAANQTYITRTPVPTTDTRITCPTPDTGTYTGSLTLRVTSDGYSFIKDNVIISIDDCTRVLSITPSEWCVYEKVLFISITGVGFTDVISNASCNFRISEDDYVVEPSTYLFDQIVCPLPEVNFTVGTVYLLISDGTNSAGSVVLTIDDCSETDYTFIAWILLGLFALLVLMSLCLLWCCIPLITGTIVGGLPPEEKKEPPKPAPPPPPPPVPELLPPVVKPGRKWEVVDASYYGGRGSGGMTPMKVTWGEKGATELGSKLTKAKDANTIEVVVVDSVVETPSAPSVVPTPPPVRVVDPPEKEPGCWDRFKKKVKRMYAVASSYRPVFHNHGTLGKKILWFPGPNIQEKLNAAEAEKASEGISKQNDDSPLPSNRTTEGSSSSSNGSTGQRRVAPKPPPPYSKSHSSSHLPRRSAPPPPDSPISHSVTTLSTENLLSN